MEKTIGKLKTARLCTKCGEIMDIKAGRGELCTICKKIAAMESIPEPEDEGSQLCWFDKIEVKKHHCKTRRALAKKQRSTGKVPSMRQCLRCGTSSSTMPLACDPDADYIGEAECRKCKCTFKRKAYNKVLCPTCTVDNEREASARSQAKKKGIPCQTSTDVAVPTVSSTNQPSQYLTMQSAHASTASTLQSSTKSSQPSIDESMRSSNSEPR